MFKATIRRAAAHAERKPLIKFLGKRTIPSMSLHVTITSVGQQSNMCYRSFGRPHSTRPPGLPNLLAAF